MRGGLDVVKTARIAGLAFNPKGIAGLQSRRLQRLRAGRFGAANKGRTLSGEERQVIEDQLRRDDAITPDKGN